MRTLLSWFRPKDVSDSHATLSIKDEEQHRLFQIQAEVDSIMRLKKSDPDKAQEMINIVHSGYWNSKSRTERKAQDEKQLYRSYVSDSRSITTFTAGTALMVANYFSESLMTLCNCNDSSSDSSGYGTWFRAGAILTGVALLYFFQRLNFQDEKSQLQKQQYRSIKHKEYYEAILLKIGREDLLTKEPEVPDEVFSPR